jgi:hypothetical protein
MMDKEKGWNVGGSYTNNTINNDRNRIFLRNTMTDSNKLNKIDHDNNNYDDYNYDNNNHASNNDIYSDGNNDNMNNYINSDDKIEINDEDRNGHMMRGIIIDFFMNLCLFGWSIWKRIE